MGQIFEELNFRQSEIVLLPYLFTDQEGSKVRPAIIVSNDRFNKASPGCILVPITSVIKNELCSIIINKEDVVSGSIPKQSRIRYDKLFAIDKNLIIMKIGRLNGGKFEEVKEKIIKLF
jgi:mRNA interferase MazF